METDRSYTEDEAGEADGITMDDLAGSQQAAFERDNQRLLQLQSQSQANGACGVAAFDTDGPALGLAASELYALIYRVDKRRLLQDASNRLSSCIRASHKAQTLQCSCPVVSTASALGFICPRCGPAAEPDIGG